MWSRFIFYSFCCFAVVNCISQNDGLIGQIQKFGSVLKGNQEESNERQGFQNTHGTSNFGQGTSSLNNGGSTFGQPTGGFGQNSNNRENGQHSTGFKPTGTSTHREGENQFNGGSSFNRPSEQNHFGTGTNEGSSHNQGEHQSGFRPGNTGGSSFNRPSEQNQFGTGLTGGSSHNEGGHLGSRPGNTGGSSFNRPSEQNQFGTGSTGESNHNQGGSQSGFRPENTGSSSFNRPSEQNQFGTGTTGGSNHNQGGNQSGFRPGSTEGSSLNRPSEHNQFGSGSTGGSSHNEGGHQEQNNNNTETENEKDEKEDDKDVCFGNLGCFKMGRPWRSSKRPVGAPHGPEKIQTKIFFYSRENLERQKNITLYPQVNMGEVRFDPNKITAMIVHGFSNSGNATWMKDMKNVYLKQVDANVMIVDWGKGAQLLNYFQVAGNTRVVGKQLGLFVKYLMQNFGANPGKFHLIGHSLGAQICSYVGKEVPGIARLTALDPAQPAFEGFDKEIRLDKTDAEFVDVIHTDARPFIPTLGFGMIEPHGHVDFYMNGGFDQPGCLTPSKKDLPVIKSVLDLAKYPVETISKMVACPHARAYEFLTESFNETEKCIFWGHKADPKNILKAVTNTVTQGWLKKLTALSTSCSKEDCIPVGFATKKSPLRGVFVVTTNRSKPYCISEPGIPPETLPQERKDDSFLQTAARSIGLAN